MRVRFTPATLRGTATVPSSKSCVHRLLICAAFARGESRLHRVDLNEDILATVDCLRALGAEISFQGDTAAVKGFGGKPKRGAAPLRCRESGSTLRFLIPAALLGGGGVFTGTERLMARGVSVYEKLWEKSVCFQREPRCLTVSGRLEPGEFAIPGDVSSQFVSGLLFALPVLEGNSVLQVTPPFESRTYVEMTLEALRAFGVAVRREGDRFEIPGGQVYRATEATAEGDWSQAAFFCVANALGGETTLRGLKPDSVQGDRVCLTLLDALKCGDGEIDLANCPDLAPALFAAAAALGRGARFTGTRRLALKESDRAQTMALELAKFGAKLNVEENAVTVAPAPLHAPAQPLQGHNDHRVVMALSVLAARYGGCLEGAEAVKKSYPDFFQVLKGLGASAEFYDE